MATRAVYEVQPFRGHILYTLGGLIYCGSKLLPYNLVNLKAIEWGSVIYPPDFDDVNGCIGINLKKIILECNQDEYAVCDNGKMYEPIKWQPHYEVNGIHYSLQESKGICTVLKPFPFNGPEGSYFKIKPTLNKLNQLTFNKGDRTQYSSNELQATDPNTFYYQLWQGREIYHPVNGLLTLYPCNAAELFPNCNIYGPIQRAIYPDPKDKYRVTCPQTDMTYTLSEYFDLIVFEDPRGDRLYSRSPIIGPAYGLIQDGEFIEWNELKHTKFQSQYQLFCSSKNKWRWEHLPKYSHYGR